MQELSILKESYIILKKVAEGGTSNIYLAIHKKRNQLCIIKKIPKESVKDITIFSRESVKESVILAELNHPYIPRLIEVVREEDITFIIMEFINGVSLDKVIKRFGSQLERDVILWGIQLCELFLYLHTRAEPIIYRDLKPANIILRVSGEIVLIDFGAAKIFRAEKREDTVCLGTVGYAAPEQFGDNGQSDERTDIYGIGTTLYHLITGENPQNLRAKKSVFRTKSFNCSRKMKNIIYKCTEPNPQNRYQSCAKLLDDLKRCNKQ